MFQPPNANRDEARPVIAGTFHSMMVIQLTGPGCKAPMEQSEAPESIRGFFFLENRTKNIKKLKKGLAILSEGGILILLDGASNGMTTASATTAGVKRHGGGNKNPEKVHHAAHKARDRAGIEPMVYGWERRTDEARKAET